MEGSPADNGIVWFDPTADADANARLAECIARHRKRSQHEPLVLSEVAAGRFMLHMAMCRDLMDSADAQTTSRKLYHAQWPDRWEFLSKGAVGSDVADCPTCKPRIELRETFVAFRHLSMGLRKCFNTYHALFEGDAKTKAVMEKSAPSFFGYLQDLLQEHYILQVCKITDPPTSWSKTAKAHVPNLTVDHLTEALAREDLATSDTVLLGPQVMKYRPLVVEPRNTLFSHADRAAHVNAVPLGGHDRQHLEQFLEDLQAFNDAVGDAIGEGALNFGCTAVDGDHGYLIRVLGAGLKAQAKLKP